jgi:hypothetical protein
VLFSYRLTAEADFTMLPPLSDNPTQATVVTFELRAHCDSTEYRKAFNKPDTQGTATIADSTCPSFDVKDPMNHQTAVLKDGDPLDMDLIIHNPSGDAIHRYRAWIAYDPSVLEGEVVESAQTYPTPTPGEMNFSKIDGYIKVSGTADTPQSATTQIVAHIRLHALPTTQSSSPITFYDPLGAVSSHTTLITLNGTQEKALAMTIPGSLVVRLTPSAATGSGTNSLKDSTGNGSVTTGTTGQNGQSSSMISNTGMLSTNTTSSSQQSESAAGIGQTSSTGNPFSTTTPAVTPGVFDLLQVQHLRVTTEGSSVFLAWDVLPSSELVGYNLYYGTISGKYVQKRSVDKNSTTITIRALPTGVTYYFAVRGINGDNRETDFSQEVGISVGNAATSTAPLTASSLTLSPKTPNTGGTITGETGLPTGLTLFLVLSAMIGTGLAFRRQLSAKV